ncbi:MAG: nucleotidyltransferase domain-containing protein [Euryarchaeota archaeon]|nr:nucleotidyltransferase domain-containing protein [Euryarchaeota archaeon]
MLEKIIGKKSKIKILRFLLDNDDHSYCLDDISKSTGISCGTVYPSLKELLEVRVITQRKVGRSILYIINKNHVLFPQIKELINFEKKSLQIIAEQFVDSLPKKDIIAVILFGSVAREEFNEKSDIDILIIYRRENVKPEVEQFVDRFLDSYDVHIVPLFITKKEIQERIKRFDNFIITIMNEGQLLYGEAPWLKK